MTKNYPYSIQEEYLELLALAQLYLFQESPSHSLSRVHKKSPIKEQPVPEKMVAPSPLLPPPLPSLEKVTPSQKLEKTQPSMSKAKPEAKKEPTAEAATSPSDTLLVLSPAPKIAETDFTAIRQGLSRLYPHQKITDTIPQPRKKDPLHAAKELRCEILIISYNPSTDHAHFLKNVAAAISDLSHPALMIDAISLKQQLVWEELLKLNSLKLILVQNDQLNNFPYLQYLPQLHPIEKLVNLSKTHLLLIENPSIYLSNAQKKKRLWHDLCQILNP